METAYGGWPVYLWRASEAVGTAPISWMAYTKAGVSFLSDSSSIEQTQWPYPTAPSTWITGGENWYINNLSVKAFEIMFGLSKGGNGTRFRPWTKGCIKLGGQLFRIKKNWNLIIKFLEAQNIIIFEQQEGSKGPGTLTWNRRFLRDPFFHCFMYNRRHLGGLNLKATVLKCKNFLRIDLVT